jgi:hypothetical protein
MVKFARKYGFLLILCLLSSSAWSDTLELRNGSVIKGKFISRTDTDISFQVGSSVQKYSVADVVSLKFDDDGAADQAPIGTNESKRAEQDVANTPGMITIPVGTRISVRTIDSIDSTKNHVGDRFQASLEEPLTVNGNVVVAKGADVYGRLAESKTSGTFTGKSQLRLELTGIVLNGQTVPIVTGEYELSGKSRGASTAKRTAGGAAVGAIIGAIAGGGKGAAIGAGAGGGIGAGSEIITKGDQVKVPSETLLDFTLQQEVSIPKAQS